MTRDQALKRAQKIYGRRAAIRANDRISSPERRAEATTRAGGLREQRTAIEAEIARREQEAGIPALRDQLKALGHQVREVALGEATYYKFQVGYIDNVIGAFNIIGHGDTWEEALAEAETKQGRA